MENIRPKPPFFRATVGGSGDPIRLFPHTQGAARRGVSTQCEWVVAW